MAEKIEYIDDPSPGTSIPAVVMPDGRRVAFEERGNPDGTPIIAFHGSPGSRVGPWPRNFWLSLANIKLITFDRPGYGLSDRAPGRAVADTARDVEVIADTLGIERFAVNARSGGVPHALGCAALLKDRVANVCAMVGLAPREAEIDWTGAMVKANQEAHEHATVDVSALEKSMQATADDIKRWPYSLLEDLEPSLTDADKEIVGSYNPIMRRIIADSHAEGLRRDAAGWIDDTIAVNQPWGFDVGDIQAKTLIWRGEHDPFSPLEHSEWLADNIQNARFILHPNASHFNAVQFLPEALVWQRDHFD